MFKECIAVGAWGYQIIDDELDIKYINNKHFFKDFIHYYRGNNKNVAVNIALYISWYKTHNHNATTTIINNCKPYLSDKEVEQIKNLLLLE